MRRLGHWLMILALPLGHGSKIVLQLTTVNVISETGKQYLPDYGALLTIDNFIDLNINN